MLSNAIIDLDSIIYAAFHPNKILDSKGIPRRTEDNSKFLYKEKSVKEVLDSCDFLMNDILTKSKATHYIAFYKGEDTIKSKLAINPEYKQDRSKESPKYWNICKEYLKLEWKAVEVNDIETDDAVRITNLAVKDSFICAIDSDLLGLSGSHYNWRTNLWFANTKEQEDKAFWSSMITGTHNNAKGIPGKGIVYAKKLLELKHHFYDSKSLVLDEYIYHFGEYEGVKEFYKNYISVKLLEKLDGFVIPNLIEVSKKQKIGRETSTEW